MHNACTTVCNLQFNADAKKNPIHRVQPTLWEKFHAGSYSVPCFSFSSDILRVATLTSSFVSSLLNTFFMSKGTHLVLQLLAPTVFRSRYQTLKMQLRALSCLLFLQVAAASALATAADKLGKRDIEYNTTLYAYGADSTAIPIAYSLSDGSYQLCASPFVY